jgi:CO/xanthine dehydrogenase FAD-binding subunit
LIGNKIKELTEKFSLLKSVGEAVLKDARPIDDLRGSAEFRRKILIVLTQRAVIKAAMHLIK